MALELKQAFDRGYATTVNSQDPANDNPYLYMSRAYMAFEVGAYFMRAGYDPARRVEPGPYLDGRTVFVDGDFYRAGSAPGGVRVVKVCPDL